MLFRRRFSRKRKPAFRPKFRRARGSSLAMRAYRLAKKVDRRAERKYFNYQYTSAIANIPVGSFTVFNPFEVAQGDGATNRDGDSATLRYIRIRFCLDSNATGNTTTPDATRILIVQDTQQQLNTAAQAADILRNVTDWNSDYYYPQLSNRFRILYDTTKNTSLTNLAYSTVTGAYNSGRIVTWQIKIKPRHQNIEWSASTGASYAKNHIWVLMSHSNAGYTVQPFFNFQSLFIDS